MVEVLLQTATGQLLGNRIADAELAAPAHIDAEVGAALRRSLHSGLLSEEDVQLAMNALSRWSIERFGGAALVLSSMRWWNNATVYDSLYLAVAMHRHAPLLTVDGPLSRAPVQGVVVENVRVTS